MIIMKSKFCSLNGVATFGAPKLVFVLPNRPPAAGAAVLVDPKSPPPAAGVDVPNPPAPNPPVSVYEQHQNIFKGSLQTRRIEFSQS